ncbi:recombinase family protein [Ileibacterium valens]|uniref:recombinase family protein n=3 Tax=Ileibacterium valens TaxID=1862668 RepID=UPI0024BA252E|nr:recombinase family protein [Ileibacterium valens]
MKKITQTRKFPEALPSRKRVAAYCRVSSNAERPQHSLATQIKYFTDLIENNPEWELAGIYSDFGISGTGTKKRLQFQQMLKDCDSGKIDMVITKSVQRFARNTVDLLKTIRHLKEKGIGVFFEKENISTLSGDGEVMLSILASLAQAESHSMSENISWAVKKEFEEGRPHACTDFLGYHWNGTCYEIVEDQAKIVRYIFDNILEQKSCPQIAKELNEMGWLGRKGYPWSGEVVRTTAKNIHYTGVLLLGQHYSESPLTHKQMKNNGERPLYLVEDAHEPIISKEQFEAVQQEFERRRAISTRWNGSVYPFTRKIVCKHCGTNYRRGRTGKYPFWGCGKASLERKAACPKSVPLDEESLMKTCTSVLGTGQFDPDVFKASVDRIEVEDRDHLHFHFKDGSNKTVELQNIWRKTYSNERKKQASAYQRDRDNVRKLGKEKPFSRVIKCSTCGGNFHSFERKYLDGSKERFWRCEHPGEVTIRNSDLEKISCEVLNLEEFDAGQFNALIKAIHVVGNTLKFEFRDGAATYRHYNKEVKKPCRRSQ